MRQSLAILTTLVTIAAGACADRNPLGEAANDLAVRSDATGSVTDPSGAPGLTVMTYNVYYGADFAPLLTAPLEQVPLIAAEAWATAVQSDFPARAGRIAAEIAAVRPHLVGLQEAAIYRLQHPGDAIVGGAVPATDVVYDFVGLILDSLAARGVPYVVAAADSTTDVELPVFTGVDGAGNPTFDDVRLTDRDAVLVRADVPFANPQHAVYQAYIPFTIGPLSSGVFEGWSAVDVTMGGRTYHFINTHLEFQEALPVQLGQADELLALLADETRPTILVGDFNSDAYGKIPDRATPTYGELLQAGFADSWIQPNRHAPGLTCCQDKDLRNAFGAFDERGDFIFARNLPAATPAGTLVVGRKILGDRPGDRTASGLWPSDHAAVVATFLTPPARQSADVARR